jgi:hypothetical protein
MEPRVSLLTLGVSDLKKAIAFYRDGLGGLKSKVGGEEVAFFKTGGVVIALFPRPSFAADAGIDVDDVEHGGSRASRWRTTWLRRGRWMRYSKKLPRREPR